jgi:hypothetical protein
MEAAMKKYLTIALITCVAVMAAAPALRGSQDKPEAMIEHARQALSASQPATEAITKALVDSLSASLLILPETGYAEEYKSRIESVRKMVKEGAMLSKEAYQDLDIAYKLVSGGKTWEIPAALKEAGSDKKGIDKATEICGQLLDAALAERKAGRDEEAVRDLLSFVILVVTPIER